MMTHVLIVVLAYLLDKWMGDPKHLPHPVRWMGSFIEFLESKWNRNRYQTSLGFLMLITVSVVFTASAMILVYVSYRLHFVIGIVVEMVLLTFMIAEKSLKDAAMDVYEPLSQNQLPQAREKLSWIVGRDTETLTEGEIVRGTVETVAENTSDSVIAPLFWAFIGGAPLAVLYRVANTADAMVGYTSPKYRQFGYAAAKWDDFLNYIPSRLTAVLMIFVNRSDQTKRQCFRLLKRDAKKHPSPNSGFPETAMAALLGIQLGGTNTYKGIISKRARLGDALKALKAVHICESVRMMQRTNTSFVLGGGIVGMAVAWIQSFLFISIS